MAVSAKKIVRAYEIIRAQRERERGAGSSPMGSRVLASGKINLDPFGLGTSLSNLHKGNNRMNNVFMGLKDEKDIQLDFLKMKTKVEGAVFSLVKKETGEVVQVPSGSRWNSEGNYYRVLKAKVFHEVDGLKWGKMVTLTMDPKKIEAMMPRWWPWGVREFSVVFGNILVTRFLKRFRAYWERTKDKYGKFRKWHYIFSIMEIQPESGMAHYHLLFRGSWVGDANEMLRMWEGSDQPAGLEISKGKYNAQGAARYICKYVTKLDGLGGLPQWAYLQKFMWYFRVRTYNSRHHDSDSRFVREKKSDYKPLHTVHDAEMRRLKIAAGSWSDEDEKVYQDGAGGRSDGLWSGDLRKDLKRIREMPILYPVNGEKESS